MPMQTALERALPIVAAAYGEQFGVKVVLSGANACTDGKTIVLPLLERMNELRDVLFGYLAHEAAHVRDSDFSTLRKCRSPVEKACTNLIEDIRVERLIQGTFPGTRFTLDATWTYIVEQGMSPAAKPEDNEATQLLQYLLHRLHYEVLHRQASASLAEASRRVVERTFPTGFFVRLDGLLGKHLDSLACSDDCLHLARAILKALQESEQEASPPRQSQEAQPGSDPSQGGQGQQTDGSNGGDATGDSRSRSGKPDSSQEEKADREQGDASRCGAGSGGNDDPDGSTGAEGQSSLSADTPDRSGDRGDSTGDSGVGSAAQERLVNETDLPEDAIGQLRARLVKHSRADHQGQPVSIRASSVGREAGNQGDTASLVAGVLASSTIRSRLLGLLQARTRARQWLHTKGKRVEGSRLARLPAGDARVFIRREEFRRPDTAVHVLLDASGSMSGKQEVANQATASLALAVSSLPGCDFAASMFPGLGGEVSPVLRRGQPVRANLARFAISSGGGTPMAEAMLYAARELVMSKRQRKVLIIITDGAPNHGEGVQYMNRLMAGHVDTYAIGIGSSAVSRYFGNWSVIHDVKALQKALFTLAGKFLDLH